jgi:hypothetical protein
MPRGASPPEFSPKTGYFVDLAPTTFLVLTNWFLQIADVKLVDMVHHVPYAHTIKAESVIDIIKSPPVDRKTSSGISALNVIYIYTTTITVFNPNHKPLYTPCTRSSPKHNPTLSSKRLQHPPRLVDLQSQIRTAPTIRMIRQHHSLVPLRQLLSRKIPFTPR